MMKFAAAAMTFFLVLACAARGGGSDIEGLNCGANQELSGNKALSDPVQLTSGEVLLTETDLHIPGRGFAFTLTRHYRSYGFVARNVPSGPPFNEWSASAYANNLIGNNWDHSYNQYVIAFNQFGPPESSPTPFTDPISMHTLWHFEGRQRIARYLKTTTHPFDPGDTVYERSEYAKYFVKVGDTLELRHGDGTVYTFGAPEQQYPYRRWLTSIVDRNDNTMTFNYTAGQLTSVVDTMGRTITFAYNNDGMLASVTDFSDPGQSPAGRQVLYAYYGASEQDGHEFDLKSVTAPAVKSGDSFGVPPEHALFPTGADHVYTYEKHASNRGKRVLKTVKNGRGQTVLENTYYEPLIQSNRYWITTQVYGGGRYDYRYVLEPPLGNDPYVVINNRAGHVKVVAWSNPFTFDINQVNRLVEYSGAADPALPTDIDLYGSGDVTPANLPVGKDRSTDPFAFDTKYTHDPDNQLLSVRELPNGDQIINTYDVAAAAGNKFKLHNLIKRERVPDGGTVGGPDSIIEAWEYNFTLSGGGGCGCGGQGFPTLYRDGENKVTTYDYFANGDLKTIFHPSATPPSGAPVEVREDFTYGADGRVKTHQLPTGGDGTRMTVSYSYGAADDGYLTQMVVDSDIGGLQLTTTYVHNAVGDLISLTDPKGNTTVTSHNQWGLVYRVEHYDGDPSTANLLSQTDRYFDADMNVLREDVKNIDETYAAVTAESSTSTVAFTTISTYDELDNLTATYEEVAPYNVPAGQTTPSGLTSPTFAITTYDYDGNDNLIEIQYPQYAEDANSDHRVVMEYDARDLLFRRIKAPSTANTITQYDYDEQKHLTHVLRAVDAAQDPATATRAQLSDRVWTLAYDGHDRLTTVTDPLANERRVLYDKNDNVTSIAAWGEFDADTGAGTLKELIKTEYTYDELNRRTRTKRHWHEFNDSGTEIASDGADFEEWTFYNPDSTIQKQRDGRGNDTVYTYDSANRLTKITDDVGNEVEYALDDNGNVTTLTSREKSSATSAVQTFVQTFVYDGLDRRIGSTDGVGNEMIYGYDSRSNLVLEYDAFDEETQHFYDGLSRLVATARDMDGDGAELADTADILTSQAWDMSSRLVGQTDDNGNETAYGYDGADRHRTTTMADGELTSILYDDADNPIQITDSNDTVIVQDFDELDRLIGRDISAAASVGGSLYDHYDATCTAEPLFESFVYDGASRLLAAEDNDSLVERRYDSLNQVQRELTWIDDDAARIACHDDVWAATPDNEVQYDYDAAGSVTNTRYPSGRHIRWTFDNVNRASKIEDITGTVLDIATSIHYAGPGRLESMLLGNGTESKWAYNGVDGVTNPTGDYGFRRIKQITHVTDGTPDVAFDDRTYAWDQNQSKKQRKDIYTGYTDPDVARTHDYSYDDIDRLTQAVMSYDTTTLTTTYNLDGVGNRTTVSGNSGVLTGTYTMDASDPPEDDVVNQYTTLPTSPETLLGYDDNGNMTTKDDDCPGDFDGDHIAGTSDLNTVLFNFGSTVPPGTNGDMDGDGDVEINDLNLFLFVYGSTCGFTDIAYDYANRMIEYVSTSPDHSTTDRHTYAYDALGRRIKKIPNLDSGGQAILFIWGGRSAWQLLEEQDESGAPLRSYVHAGSSGYIDHVVSMRAHGPAKDKDYWYHADDLFSTMVVTKADGTVAERYEYDDYGKPRVMDEDNDYEAPIGDSLVDNRVMFTGRYYDTETGLYYYRTRYMDPVLGRFTTRDTIGVWGDAGNLGNGVNYVGSCPTSAIDPYGLLPTPGWDPLNPFPQSTRPIVPSPIPVERTYTNLRPWERENMPPHREMPDFFEALVDELEREMDNGRLCLRTLYLDGHDISNGQGGRISCSWRDTLSCEEYKRWSPEKQERMRENWERLGRLLCPNGRIQIVQCNAGKGDAGKELQKMLEEWTQRPVDMWPGPVRWLDLPLLDPIPINIFPWKKSKSKG